MIYARIALACVLWTIMASALFVLLGRLWAVYPPPAMFWQWPHYLLLDAGDPVVARLLAISAAPPTLLLIAGAALGLRRIGKPRKPALYGETIWATDREAARAGFAFDKGLEGGGIVLGRHDRGGALLTFPGDEHVALYAPDPHRQGRPAW